MAKNFPYFKFTATEWLTGDIVYESLELQGLFINVCALYWQRDGKLTIEDLIRRYKNESLINQLIDRYIWNEQGNIFIKFLTMAKHSLLFATSVIAFPIVGTYRAVNNKPSRWELDGDGLPVIFSKAEEATYNELVDIRFNFQAI